MGKWTSTRKNPHHLGHLKDYIPGEVLSKEHREARVEDFINLRQGGMSVNRFSFKFFKISKYPSSLVSNSRDEMSRFVTGVSEDLEYEFREAMLHDNMELCRLTVHAQQVEESRW